MRWDAFSPDYIYGLSGVIHIMPQRGMLLICATGGINNLPFQGVIQFVVIHQGVAFGLKFSNISLILRLRASATSFKKEDSPCSAFCYKIRLFCQLQKNIYF
jgi:hypothetical protein